MTEEEAAQIVDAIMHEENVDNLRGFGDITMGRIKAMLMNATKTGYVMGYSEGFREAEG